jgi:CheY-like chemotaxis protein
LKPDVDLEKELNLLGLLDKAREIYSEIGEDAALSYIKSSYRLLSKIYHPDLHQKDRLRAEEIQKKINKVASTINRTPDYSLVEYIKKDRKEDRQEKVRKRWRVLVVEDEFGLQDVLRSVLTMEGYEARVAVDGLNGYRVFREFRPDLIITDVVMPNMSGIELIQKIRRETPRIKVIFMSGFFGVKRLKKELDDEIINNNYPTLSKPFKVSHMLDVVKDYLGN